MYIQQKSNGMTDFEVIKNKLEMILKKERYVHTLGVMYTAASIAMRYGENIETAMLAGLLHDCGKYCSEEEQIAICQKNNVLLTPSELAVPAMVHAKLGAFLAEYEYHVEDQNICNAILYHTTGRPDMTMLEKIIFLADYIEPGRKMIPGLTEIRTLTFQDIDKAVCLCAQNTLNYLNRVHRPIDPMTQKTYEFYTKM